MQKIIFYTTLFLIPVLSNSQNTQKNGKIKKDKKGSIYAVEFSPSMDKNKKPKSSNIFLEEYLEITSNDQFKKVAHKSKKN
jgi:hypothetical protein